MNRRILALVAIALPLAACSAGGAGVPYFFERDDPSPGTRESPTGSREGPSGGTSSGNATGGTSSGGSSGACPANCAGRFTCTDSTGDRDNVTLRASGDGCTGDGFTLKCDGSVVVASSGGQSSVGTWSSTGTGFSARLGNQSTTCVPRADDTPVTPPSPPTVVDAGVSDGAR